MVSSLPLSHFPCPRNVTAIRVVTPITRKKDGGLQIPAKFRQASIEILGVQPGTFDFAQFDFETFIYRERIPVKSSVVEFTQGDSVRCGIGACAIGNRHYVGGIN